MVAFRDEVVSVTYKMLPLVMRCDCKTLNFGFFSRDAAHRGHKTTRLAVQNHHRTPTPMVHETLSIFAETTAGTVSLL